MNWVKVALSSRARSISSPIVPSGDCSIPCAAHVRQARYLRESLGPHIPCSVRSSFNSYDKSSKTFPSSKPSEMSFSRMYTTLLTATADWLGSASNQLLLPGTSKMATHTEIRAYVINNRYCYMEKSRVVKQADNSNNIVIINNYPPVFI